MTRSIGTRWTINMKLTHSSEELGRGMQPIKYFNDQYSCLIYSSVDLTKMFAGFADDLEENNTEKNCQRQNRQESTSRAFQRLFNYLNSQS